MNNFAIKCQGTPQQMIPTKWTWGLQHADSDLLDAKFRGYFVLLWSSPSRSIFKMLLPGVSLSTLKRFWMRRYWCTLRRWLFCNDSSLFRSISVVALLHRALNSAHVLHLHVLDFWKSPRNPWGGEVWFSLVLHPKPFNDNSNITAELKSNSKIVDFHHKHLACWETVLIFKVCFHWRS